MHAVVALTLAHSLDILRRGGTAVLALAGVAFILSLRWFSAFGLGYEVVQLKELAVYTVGLLCAVAVLLFCLPGEDESEQAEALLLTRPIRPATLALGTFFGRLLPVMLLCAVWLIAIYAALQWFELEDPQLFSYQGAESAFAETASTIVPVIGQLFATAMLLAFLQPVARTRRPVLIGVAALGIYLLGYSVASFGGVWSVVLPDMSRHDVTSVLWDANAPVPAFSLLIHACAWCAAGVALDSAGITLKTAT